MEYKTAILTISDKGSRGERTDTSGPALKDLMTEKGFEVIYTKIIPDDRAVIAEELRYCADKLGAALVLTTGGTGFSQRDITPEATKDVIDRDVPGFSEVMRAESMKITPRGCLSRGISGLRNKTLIINLPGSRKAALENLLAVIEAIPHGIETLLTEGSTDCAPPEGTASNSTEAKGPGSYNTNESGCAVKTVSMPDFAEKILRPSLDDWLKDAEQDGSAKQCGMYLFHNGKVRETPKAEVRFGENIGKKVCGMQFSCDKEKLSAAVAKAKAMPGIYYVKAWVAEGRLSVGDDIMLVLVGGDIRTHVMEALHSLLSEIKTECVSETELLDDKTEH